MLCYSVCQSRTPAGNQTVVDPHTRDRPYADYECKEGGQGNMSEQKRNCRSAKSCDVDIPPHEEGVPQEDTLLVWDIVPLEHKAQRVEDAQQGEHPQKVE